jgi:hypothetical protein
VTERDFSKQIVTIAHEYGWMVAHFHQLQGRKGIWITPAAADGKGFPDIVLVRERLIFAELKVGYNPLRVDQQRWLDALLGTGAEAYVWKPKDIDQIEEILAMEIPLGRLSRLIAASGDLVRARQMTIDSALTQKRKSGPKAASLVSTQPLSTASRPEREEELGGA